MAELGNLRDAFIDEIKDLYDMEHQLTRALPKMAKAATSDVLRDALESHLEETRGQATKLEKVFKILGKAARGKHCAGIAGIIEEGSEKLKENDPSAVLDACIIGGGQRAEHYEIAAYGTAIAWAEALGETKIAELLNEILDEEKAADEKLSSLAEAGINEAATMDDEQEEKEMAAPAAGRKRSK